MSISESHTTYRDEFISSVGKFETDHDSSGYILRFDGRRIGLYPDRLSAHQAIADQKTGHLEWDGLQRNIALEQIRSDLRWTRHSLKIHAVGAEGLPMNARKSKTSGHVPPTARPHIPCE